MRERWAAMLLPSCTGRAAGRTRRHRPPPAAQLRQLPRPGPGQNPAPDPRPPARSRWSRSPPPRGKAGGGSGWLEPERAGGSCREKAEPGGALVRIGACRLFPCGALWVLLACQSVIPRWVSRQLNRPKLYGCGVLVVTELGTGPRGSSVRRAG